MEPKFKIGDRVKVIIGTDFMRGKTATILRLQRMIKILYQKKVKSFYTLLMVKKDFTLLHISLK